jgi:hypothetical protein
MATIGQEKIETAKKIAVRTNKLGRFLFLYCQVFYGLVTIGLIAAMILGYEVGKSTAPYWNGESLEKAGTVDWQLVWANWGVMLGSWLGAIFFITVIAVFSSMAQSKAESLEIQILQAQP